MTQWNKKKKKTKTDKISLSLIGWMLLNNWVAFLLMLYKESLCNSLFVLFTCLELCTLPTLVCIPASQETLSIFPSTWLHAAPVMLTSLHFFMLISHDFHLTDCFYSSNKIFFPTIELIFKITSKYQWSECLRSTVCSPALYYKPCTQPWHKEKWFDRNKLPHT